VTSHLAVLSHKQGDSKLFTNARTHT